MSVHNPAAFDTHRARTPGAYMKQCRIRGQMSVGQVAAVIAVSAEDRAQARADLHRMENDVPGDYARLVRCMADHAPFAFNHHVFLSLAAETCDPSLPAFDA